MIGSEKVFRTPTLITLCQPWQEHLCHEVLPAEAQQDSRLCPSGMVFAEPLLGK